MYPNCHQRPIFSRNTPENIDLKPKDERETPMITTTIIINNWHNFTNTSVAMELEVLEPNLTQRPTAEIKERLRQAYEHYVQTTDDGQQLIKENYDRPTWGHLLSIPNEYLEPYGVRRLDYHLSTIVLEADNAIINTTPRKEDNREDNT